MDATLWERVSELFSAALALQPDQRLPFLDRECGTEPELRAEVVKLLQADGAASSEFLASPAQAPRDDAVRDFAACQLGRTVAGYQLKEVHGRGGMGIVYRACSTDPQFQREVAIKLLLPGSDIEVVPRRFRTERQVLANLNHPHIVQLLDGGLADDGLPFLVMEFVDGIPLDQYCDREQLTICKRVALFRDVCDAVQFAHQNLVIHRDIKTTNILVTSRGQVRLLDFGIAKLLSPEETAPGASVTGTWERALTPQYASPEQLAGNTVTTATDIYSLGVTLFLILTGRFPQPAPPLGIDPIRRTTGEPPRPSTAVTRTQTTDSRAAGVQDTRSGVDRAEQIARLRGTTAARLSRQLRGDLDRIVMKALRSDPTRRYASAEQLSDDLHRFLERLPIRARPESWWYLTDRFVRRHWSMVTVASLLVCSLIAGLAATTIQTRKAGQAARVAERQQQIAMEALSTLVFGVQNKLAAQPGNDALREELLQTALTGLDKVLEAAPETAGATRERYMAHQRRADIYRFTGRTADANRELQVALRMAESASAAEPRNPRQHIDCAIILDRLGDAALAANRLSEAQSWLTRSLRHRQESTRLEPDNVESRQYLGALHVKLGDVASGQNRSADAAAAYTQAMEIARALRAGHPDRPQLNRTLATAIARMAELQFAEGKLPAARHLFQEAVQLGDRVGNEVWHNERTLSQVATLYQLGITESYLGEFDAAALSYGQAVDLLESILMAEPSHADARRRLAIMRQQFADLHLAKAEWDRALQELDEADHLYEQVLADDPDNMTVRYDMIMSLDRRWNVLASRPDLPGALATLKRLVAALQALDQSQQLEHALFREMYAARQRTLAAWEQLPTESPTSAEDHPPTGSPVTAERWRAVGLQRLAVADWPGLRKLIESVRQPDDLTPGTRLTADDHLTLAGLWTQLAVQGDLAVPLVDHSAEVPLALDHLQEAVELDRSTVNQVRTHPWLIPLRPLAEFRQLFERAVAGP